MRRTGRMLAGVAVLALLALGPAGGYSTDSYLGRWIWWNRSDVGDIHRFPARPIAHRPSPSSFRFIPGPAGFDPFVDFEHSGDAGRIRLSALARDTETTSLLVVRGDTVLYEGYFGGHTRDSLVTSFSVAKSITSLLVGIAIDDGLLGSLDDPITRYLPELRERDPRFARITLRHLLDMRSGIEFRDHDLPWGDKARAYYDPHLRERVLEEIGIQGPPGDEWQYNTYNPQLLGLALERASGESVAEFTSTRLWRPLGMEYPASWSVDGTRDPMEKMESGLNGRAVDFARLGRLVLREGRWEGGTVVSESWMEASTTSNPTCEIAKFRPRRICYRLGWWITPPGEGRRHAVEGRGHLGQYVSIFPRDELVMVRFGRETGGVSWPAVFQSLADRVAP